MRLSCTFVAVALGAAVASAADPAPPSFRDAIERVRPATVRLVTPATPDEGGHPSLLQDAIRRFGTDLGDGSRLLGSGIVISSDGEIITSRHVVQDVSRLRVRLPNDEELTATVVGTDEASDLALVRVTLPAGITPVALDVEPTASVGDWLVVLGNGAGPLPAAVAGMLGAKGRILGLGTGPDLLQLGITLLPMASGGPIIDARGDLVGLATAVDDPSAIVPGVAFGVPVELVRWFVGQIHERGRIVRGWLGLTVQPVTPDLAAALRLPAAEGALVAEVAAGSPAARAGIRRGDVVTRIGDHAVRRAGGVPGMVSSLEPGSTASVSVIRNGRQLPFELAVREEPAVIPRVQARPVRGVEANFGLTVRSATAQEVKRFGLAAKTAVMVTAIDEGSAADEGGLEAGDVILTANREAILSVLGLRKALRTGGDHALLQVRRGTASLFVELDR